MDKPMDEDSIAVCIQSLTGAVLALIKTHPDGALLSAEIDRVALVWEAQSGASLNSDHVIEETVKQLRRYALLARNPDSQILP